MVDCGVDGEVDVRPTCLQIGLNVGRASEGLNGLPEMLMFEGRKQESPVLLCLFAGEDRVLGEHADLNVALPDKFPFQLDGHLETFEPSDRVDFDEGPHGGDAGSHALRDELMSSAVEVGRCVARLRGRCQGQGFFECAGLGEQVSIVRLWLG